MSDVNQFLTTYSSAVIFVIALIFIFLLIVILKQKKEHPKDLTIHEEKGANKTKQPIETQQAENIIISDEHTIVKNETPTIKAIEPRQKTIQKRREFVSHGLITKESFKVFAGSKLLIAEDNIINQKVIKGMLGDSGIQIIMADNGQEALDILKNDKDIYIVLMDAHMPIVDGFEATQQIRTDRSLDHLLVVALSGDTAVDDIKKMKDAGMQEYLEKPLKLEKLYDILYCYMDTINDNVVNFNFSEKTTLLHVNEGIQICGGDNELYKEILLECLTMYKDANQKIRSLMAKEDVNTTKKLLLDISGISANIGADKLAQIATKFREILNHDRKEEFFAVEEEFTNNLFTIIQEIELYLH